MSATKTLLRLEFKNLLAGRAVLIGLALVGVASLYCFYHGRTVIERQRRVIAAAPALQRQQLDHLVAVTPPDRETGELLYYQFFHTKHEPSAWAPFSLGVRDVNPFNVKVRLLALEGHLYDSDLNNPHALAAGNFDFAFVIVFLFPLLIIALTHNLVSAEREQGTWGLLLSQPTSPAGVLWLKLLVRATVVFVPAALLFVGGGLYLGAPFDSRFFSAAAIAAVYFSFWFGVALLVVAWRRSSTFNALSMLGLWLLLTIIGPLLLNVAVATYLPVPEALEVTVRQRQGYHGGWDKSKAETMGPFYRRYPQWADYPVPPDAFSWGWYYAMHQAGDDAAAEASTQLRRNLSVRHEQTRRWAALFPPAQTQLLFNRLAQTDLDSHLSYLDSVRRYYEELKATFYPGIFRRATLADAKWDALLPEHRHADDPHDLNLARGLFSLSLAALLTLTAGAWISRNVGRAHAP